METMIEARRKEIGLSRDELISLVGICPKTYYLYTAVGKSIPSDKLLKFAQTLKCSADYLLRNEKYIHITVTDNTGALLADISRDKIIERKGVKVILA